MSRPFDGPSQEALVFGAVTRDSTRDNFSLFCQKLAQPFNLFVVDRRGLLTAKTADLLAKKSGAPPRPSLPGSSPRSIPFLLGSHLKGHFFIRGKFLFRNLDGTFFLGGLLCFRPQRFLR